MENFKVCIKEWKTSFFPISIGQQHKVLFPPRYATIMWMSQHLVLYKRRKKKTLLHNLKMAKAVHKPGEIKYHTKENYCPKKLLPVWNKQKTEAKYFNLK